MHYYINAYKRKIPIYIYLYIINQIIIKLSTCLSYELVTGAFAQSWNVVGYP